MGASGSDLRSSWCVKRPAKAGKFGNANRLALVALAMALFSSEYLSGCAGVVVSSTTPANHSGGGSPTPTPTTQAQLSVSPTSASFPNVLVGSTNSQTVTVQNTGNASATITNITVAGTGFGTSGLSLPLVIAAGQSSAFNITFAASASGNASGSVVLASNAANSPLMISLAGTAIAVSRLLGSNPASLSFGNVTLGSSSSLGATLTNNGNANVTISGVSVTGTGFAVSGVGTNTVVSAGQSVALSTTFAPSVAGGASGTITVASDASNVVTLAVGGTGVPVSSHSVAVTWNPSTSQVVGYFVYRQPGIGGSFTKLNSAPVALTQFTDDNVQNGQSYTYVVTAIDADNNESEYSAPAEAVIPTT